ncbi:MAG: hypothetical protein JKX98_06995 [Alcanivoracaceae bacterium]|nr:hypothetical protein [Alcanivoracaceae bacterium]
MKKIMSFLLFFTATTHAFTIWPNAAAPCNGTLQACIDGSPEGEFIEIQTNGPINEDIFTNKVVSLVAGSGYKPVFTEFNSIFIQSGAATSRSVTVKGLTLVRG